MGRGHLGSLPPEFRMQVSFILSAVIVMVSIIGTSLNLIGPDDKISDAVLGHWYIHCLLEFVSCGGYIVKYHPTEGLRRGRSSPYRGTM